MVAPPPTEKPNYHVYQTKRFTYVLPEGKTPRYSAICNQVGDWFENPSQKVQQTIVQEVKNAAKGIFKLLVNDESVEERLLPGGHLFRILNKEGEFNLDPVIQEFQRIQKLSPLEKTVMTIVESVVLYLKALLGISAAEVKDSPESGGIVIEEPQK